MNKKEAEEKLYSIKGETLGLCPLLKYQCSARCVCFVPAQIINIAHAYAQAEEKENNYSIQSAYCMSPLISGYIEINH